ncbi:MerR family transcriptional regulator [Novosphingobium sp.]|uniref:MerR family transcriptional regulator n=1 Tax=Novosphingobium sp. TaxID=1874826 RepID=UPI002B4692BF|nr:MerR family transcriptional regulator [Novosphingobium sp.]HKR93571.1 MerR family transcriptional regulator [Novosphingobium sp.]
MSGSPVFEFDDGKDPQALRTIGEVAGALGIRQHVLRYWEEQFPALQPIKRSGGRRYYRPQDVALIVEIDRLVHREGYTLRGARKAIEDKAVECEGLAPANGAPAADDDLRRRLMDIRRQLAEALAAA